MGKRRKPPGIISSKPRLDVPSLGVDRRTAVGEVAAST